VISTAAGWTIQEDLLVEGRLRSLGLRHAFTTRRSGDMKEPANRKAAAARLGLPEPATLTQVHGTTIHVASKDARAREGDGWIVDSPGIVVGVYVADCVPLYVWSEDATVAGVFHAGWRGLAAGMAKAAVEALRRHSGATAARLSAAIGPHIGACCYKVGPELEKSFPASSFVRGEDGLRLDLAAETRRQLLEAGLSPERLGAPAPCTASDPDCYFSFRRDKRDARMLALLSLEPWPS